MSLKLKYTLPLLLITLLCIGGVEAFYFYLGKRVATRQAEPAETVEAAREEVRQPVAKDEKQAVDISAITRRNLFASRSKAVEVETDQDPLAGVELSSLAVVLMGTITGGGDDEQRAIIHDKKDNRQDLYQEGDFIQQALIKKIMRGKVILTLNGKDEMLDISEARNVSVPQVNKAVPVTTAQRVIGRPVGGAPARPQTNSNVIQRQAGSNVVIPKSGSPRQLRSFRGGVIVKGRNTSGQ